MGQHIVFTINALLRDVTQAEQVCMCNQKLENTYSDVPQAQSPTAE